MSLPSGYKRLEYIQSSGTQYVNTGVVVSKNLEIKLRFMLTSITNPGIVGYIQSASSGTNRFAVFQYGGAWYFDFGNETTGRISGGSFSTNTLYDITVGNRYIKNNATESNIISGSVISNLTNSNSISILCEMSCGIGRIYACQIYENGTLVRDYIPCQTSSGDIGLWDDVNSVFYGNAGTGTFTAGPVIAIAADASEITKLEYIQSYGNQWIDSGIVPGSSDFSVKSKIRTTAATSAENWFVTIGHSKPSGTATFAQFGTWSSKFVIHLTYVVVDGSTAATSNDVTIDFSIAGNTASLSGDASYSVTNANFGSGSFRNQSITICDGLWRTYWCQITVGGTLVREYIAAKLSDGTVGLYDKLNGLLYINVGSGTFTAGPSSLNLPVNIGGTWKEANEAFVNIGGTWKAVEAAFVNIGGTWKELG